MLQEEQINKLTRLKELLDSGILSEEEFAREKAKVFSSSSSENHEITPTASRSAGSEKKKKKSKAAWIVLGCLAGLFILFILIGALSSDDSYSSYDRYDEIDNFISDLGYNPEMDIQRIGDTVYSNYLGETDFRTDMLMGYLSGRELGIYFNSDYDDSSYQSARIGFITAGRKDATKTAFYRCMARNQINYVYQIHGRDVFSYTWDEIADYY